MILPCIFALLISSSHPLPAAQTVGGGSETLHQWDGMATGDYLGRAVSGAGDVNADGFDDLIVGAPRASTGGIFVNGSVMVYSGADGALLYQWNGSDYADALGDSVAGAGDVNQDGYDDLIIGAPTQNVGSFSDAGSIYVYSGIDGALLYQWNGEKSNHYFGHCVSGAGDVNADGFDDMIMGTPHAYNGSTSDAGMVRVYSGADGSVLYQWSGVNWREYLGMSVDGAGDVNGDGYADLILGAAGLGVGGNQYAGAAYVYSGLDGSILHQWFGQSASFFLGWSVAGAGDIDADGFADVVVGEPWTEVAGKSSAGSAYAYSGLNGTLIHQWGGPMTGGQLGYSVSGAGDFNGDGYDDLILGQPSSNVGVAYVASGMDGSMLQQWEGSNMDSRMGFFVSGAGDVNQDGRGNVIVGSSTASPGGIFQAGQAFVFGFNPFLKANTETVSASVGGMIKFGLDFGEESAFYQYKILISASGIGPTTYGTDIPLTMDGLVVDTFNGIYPVPVYTGMSGTLDANGTETLANLTIPAGLPAGLIGNVYHFAAIANPTGLLPEYSSVALPLTIIP